MGFYQNIKAVNWSSLKYIRTSPLEYQYQLNRFREDATHFRIGRAVHTLILEPDLFADRHPLFEGASRRGSAWAGFVAEHDSTDPSDILIESELARVMGCVNAIKANPLAMRQFSSGVKEHVVTWEDPDFHVQCKCRIDVCGGHITELKSAADVTPRTFASQAAQLGYHGQIAFYLDGAIKGGLIDPESAEPQSIVSVASEPPHDVVVWTVPAETVDIGRCLYKKLLLTLEQCLESGEWPGVADHEIPLLLPAWATAELEDDDPNRTITIGGIAVQV